MQTANYIIILLYIGAPSKPLVVVLPTQQIELGINNFTLLMRCSSYNINFNYKWEKKNTRLPSKARGVNSWQLEIINLKLRDSGRYRCIMSNATGMIASDYSLITIKGLSINIHTRYIIMYTY